MCLGKKRKMDSEAAQRIQSAVDRKGGDEGFKSRAMRAAAKNEEEE